MSGEGGGDIPHSSSFQDQTRSNRRHSPHPHAMPHHRPFGGRPRLPHSSGYAASSPLHSENIHNVATSPSLHFSPPYDQRSVYRPTLMHTQSPTPPYSYHQQYRSGIPDGSMVPQNFQASYQPIMQPPSVMYQYQQQQPSGGGSSLSLAPPVYPHHQPNASPPPHNPFPPSSAGQSGNTSYPGTGPYQALRYPSPINPQYAYHSHSYPGSPVYPSPYAPSPYSQHYPSPIEQDRQTGWWYVPHVAQQHQYEGGPYLGHYSVPYTAGTSHHENSSLAPSPSSPTASGLYAMSPTRPPIPSGQPATSPPPPIANTGSSSPDVSSQPGNNRPPSSEKPVVRRSYHPNPPSHRSEWVMWAGNVPSDATYDELWRFFNQPPDPSSADLSQPGVLSIFLISRSCCAFVNFDSEGQLQQTIKRFNGKPLRPDDSRCPRLVCRVRKKDDDLKAGVGGQRGMGIHTRWVKDQKGRAEAPDHSWTMSLSSSPPPPGQLVLGMSTLSFSDEQDFKQHVARHSSSSGSYASTSSSILTRHFPQRYFILKSLTQVSPRTG